MYLNRHARGDTPSVSPPAKRARVPWLIQRALRYLEAGRLTIILPSGARIEHVGTQRGPHGVLELHNTDVFRRMLTRGDVGFAEGYIEGDWTSPDLPQLIALAAQNVARLDPALEGLWPVRMWRKLHHAFQRNSARGSRRNISFHYDLGNDFYRLWLDDSMTYSSAMAIPRGTSLEQAQHAKLDRITALMALSGTEEVLEIGCGWGALAMRMARECSRVTGLTLSHEQLIHAGQKVAASGLAGKVDLRLQDYRAVDQRYDRIVSIEMLEAVGEAYWPVYFERLRACLAPGGRIVLQAITIREDRFAAYKRNPDFIQRYIFPGGMLPTPAILARQAARAGLAITHCETFGAGYADTLAEWRGRFNAVWPRILALGFEPRFRLLWDYYLAYCEAGFRTGTIDVGLYVLEEAP
jgi:cyclopropane-fatty-acyl-phospholipid synthase